MDISTFAFHDTMLPYSPTTLKIDKNSMSKQTDGYVKVIDGKLTDIRFNNLGNGLFKMDYRTLTKET